MTTRILVERHGASLDGENGCGEARYREWLALAGPGGMGSSVLGPPE